jgi:fructose-1,6-bisphosphatase
MVADVHRTILYGGIFLYPGDKKVFIIKYTYIYTYYLISSIESIRKIKSFI